MLFLSTTFIVVEVHGGLLSPEYDASVFPSMWMIFTGNITLDSSTALTMMTNGKLPLATTLTYSAVKGLETNYIFPFSIGVKGKDLGTLALDDINNVALDVDEDYYGESVRMAATSFLSSATELFENTTDVNGVTEYYFWEHSTYFDSDTYPYLLLEDVGTPSDVNSKIVIGTGSGNVTIYDDILLGSGGGDIWFRLDQHASHGNIYNITITDLRLSEVTVFDLKGDDQWSDSRYNSVYVGEAEYDAVGVLNSPYPSGIIREYQPSWNLGEGRTKDATLSGIEWLNSINASEVLACRSNTAEAEGIVRASGWSTYQELENDLLNAIASWEGIDVSGIRDYACEKGIAMWKQSNSDVVDAMHEEVRDVALRTNDIQTFVDLVAEKTMPSSVFLVGTDSDVFGKSASEIEKAGDIGGGDGLITIDGTFTDWIKQAAEKVYDVTTGAIASVKNVVGGTIQWGQDLIGGVVSGATGTITGIVDTGGEIAKNVVGAVTSKDGVLNPMSFMDKVRKNLVWILIVGGILIIALIIGIVLIVRRAGKTVVGVSDSELAKNVEVSANAKDFV